MTITPNTVSSWCRTLSLYREELANKPSHQAALNIQNAQRMLHPGSGWLSSGRAHLTNRKCEMNCITTFGYKGHPLRVVMINDEPWFIASDVLASLGLARNGSTSQNLRGLDQDQVKLIERSKVARDHPNFPNRGAVAISESGLYLLTLRSDKPEAKPFQYWGTREVLPAIRKTGGYLLNETQTVTNAGDRKAQPVTEEFSQTVALLNKAMDQNAQLLELLLEERRLRQART